MTDGYVQDHVEATPWDDTSTKSPNSAVRDVTISIVEGEVELSTASGDRLAVGPVVGTVVSKLVAGFTRTMAGVIVDFGDHKWMINFGALSRPQPRA